jgi:MEMO1 family protein
MQSHGDHDSNSVVHSRRVGPPARGNRPATAAGRLYPKNASALRSLVEGMIAGVPVPEGDRLAEAYIVPHAPITMSGRISAQVYARLRRHAAEIDRVILLGPAHDVREVLTGCVAPSAATWTTPLGRVPIDGAVVRQMVSDGHVRSDDGPHRAEHSLEVQLPFLQVAVPDAVIVPVLVGVTSTADMAVTLATMAATERTVVVATTDLGEARTAGRTLLSIVEMAADRIGDRDACGVYALRGLIRWADHRHLRAELIAREADHVACSFVRTDQL